MIHGPEPIKSSGNVFADLGVSNAEEELAKAQLARTIRRLIKDMDITQAEAAKRMGADQSRVSALMNGRIAAFTLDRLVRYLTALRCDVRIEVSAPHSGAELGKVMVHAA